jgi:hypothetical protein
MPLRGIIADQEIDAPRQRLFRHRLPRSARPLNAQVKVICGLAGTRLAERQFRSLLGECNGIGLTVREELRVGRPLPDIGFEAERQS